MILKLEGPSRRMRSINNSPVNNWECGNGFLASSDLRSSAWSACRDFNMFFGLFWLKQIIVVAIRKMGEVRFSNMRFMNLSQHLIIRDGQSWRLWRDYSPIMVMIMVRLLGHNRAIIVS